MNSGIYKIKNLCNEQFYIGSSNNLKKRKAGHFSELERNVHKNNHLQSSYNLYGKESFEFEVIEYCESRHLIEREQYWIDQYDFNLLYNIRHTANSNLGLVTSEETKKKLRDFNLGKKLNTETCRKMSEYRTGRSRPDFARVKIANTLAKTYYFLSPGGQEVVITNLQKYCKENNLCTSHMNQVYHGKRKQHKGWKRIQ